MSSVRAVGPCPSQTFLVLKLPFNRAIKQYVCMYTEERRMGSWDSRLIYFSCPLPARRRRPRRALLAGNGVCRAFPSLGNWCGDGLTLLFDRDISSADVMSILAVVSPYLKSQNDVKNQCEEEARQNKGVFDLSGGGKQPCKTAKDLRRNGKGGQLPSRLCPMVLCDLRELGE